DMGSLDTMPDFGSPLAAGELALFAPLLAGPFSVVPNALELASDGEGRPVFSLQIVKRADDLSPDGQYAVLDVQLKGRYALDEALVAARTHRPSATVKPASIDLGYGRLVSPGPDIKLPDDLTAPAPLGWWCADGARWTRRIDRGSGELIKGALVDGT